MGNAMDPQTCATFRPLPPEVRYRVTIRRRVDSMVVVGTRPVASEEMAVLIRPLRALYPREEYDLKVEVTHDRG